MLWLLGLVPLLVVGLALRYDWRRRQLARLGHLEQIKRLAAAVSPARRLLKAALLVLGVTLVILSLARPQAGERSTLAPRVGIDIVVALDFSKSMLARDAYPSRIERAKAELNRLIDSLGGDRLGMVAFAGDAVAYPLTTDYTAAKLFWRDMSPLDMPVGGTALGKAITAGARLLAGVRGKGQPRAQVLLLLTDGEDHESEPLKAAEDAAKKGVRIYAVGIGSRSGEPVPEVDDSGKIVGYMKKPDGGFVTTRLDEKTLKAVAAATKGRYIAMDPKSFAVEPILKAIKKLKQAETKARLIKHYDEAFAWFLFPGFLLLLLEACLPERRRRRAEEAP